MSKGKNSNSICELKNSNTRRKIRITTHIIQNNAHLGVTHESLPDHEGRKDDHCQIQQLKEKLTFIGPELL